MLSFTAGPLRRRTSSAFTMKGTAIWSSSLPRSLRRFTAKQRRGGNIQRVAGCGGCGLGLNVLVRLCRPKGQARILRFLVKILTRISLLPSYGLGLKSEFTRVEQSSSAVV